MGRRSHTQTLYLWINGAFVGTWSVRPRVGDVLLYDDEWVASAQGRPLSLSLPFTPGNQPHRGDAVRTWFENLLPDSKDIRERIARRFQTRSTEAFTLLAEIGRDCVGALQILPDSAPPKDLRKVTATPLNNAEVAQVLRNTVAPSSLDDRRHEDDHAPMRKPRPSGRGQARQSQNTAPQVPPYSGGEAPADTAGVLHFRVSIAGAQEKTALLHLNGQWCLPHGSTPTTHILKLPLGLVGNLGFDMSDSVENEWLCSRILHAYGLPVAPAHVLQFEDMKVLAVERFDRTWWEDDNGGRWLLRLPQEDICQATGTPPYLKYESDGGPGMDSVMKLLATSINPDRDRRTFFQAQVIFWMLRATDGHAKNFSLFLRPGGAYELTPLYDVLSAYPVIGTGAHQLSPYKAKMAMAVRSKNTHRVMRDIVRRHWLAVGTKYGVIAPDGRGAEAVLDELIAQTPEVVRRVRSLLPEKFPRHVADSILNGLQTAARKLAG